MLALLLTPGCATVNHDTSVYDPWEAKNRQVFKLNSGLDGGFVQSLAKAYKRVTPQFLRSGVTNFYANIADAGGAIHSFLQAKPVQGFTSLGRFGLNTTVGLGGLFDIASKTSLQRQPEDIGQTLAVWGWQQDSYLVTPAGPTSSRDIWHLPLRHYVLPRALLGDLYSLPLFLLGVINYRAETLELTDRVKESALDEYIFIREGYRQKRREAIYDGNPPAEDWDELFDDELFEQ
ncbi:MAG: MlaA family lipoprotein [Pseudomonadales bacterium]